MKDSYGIKKLYGGAGRGYGRKNLSFQCTINEPHGIRLSSPSCWSTQAIIDLRNFDKTSFENSFHHCF